LFGSGGRAWSKNWGRVDGGEEEVECAVVVEVADGQAAVGAFFVEVGAGGGGGIY